MIELYVVPGGAPSLACQQTLKALNVDFALKSVNFNIGEFLTPEFEKVHYYSLNILKRSLII